MLEQVLNYLNNWFVITVIEGTFTIENGGLELSNLANGQYFRILGSVFNDGLHEYGENMDLTDETFEGAIWCMAVPKAVIEITSQIKAWYDKYGEAASSPYTSESFGGYSYSKGGNSSDSTGATWQAKFADVLKPYRKLKEMAPVAAGTSYQGPPYRRPYNPSFPWG